MSPSVVSSPETPSTVLIATPLLSVMLRLPASEITAVTLRKSFPAVVNVTAAPASMARLLTVSPAVCDTELSVMKCSVSTFAAAMLTAEVMLIAPVAVEPISRTSAVIRSSSSSDSSRTFAVPGLLPRSTETVPLPVVGRIIVRAAPESIEAGVPLVSIAISSVLTVMTPPPEATETVAPRVVVPLTLRSIVPPVDVTFAFALRSVDVVREMLLAPPPVTP